MTVHWTLYDETTGEILRSGITMDAVQANGQAQGGGVVVLTESDQASQYVDTGSGTVSNRSAMNVSGSATVMDTSSIDADGSDLLTISNVPNGATVMITVPANAGINNIDPTVVTDGEVEITTVVAGAYTVRIQFGNFADFVGSFNAV